MLSEMEILKRMDAINCEFAQIPQIENFDLTLEAVGTDGTVKATIRGLHRKGDCAEKVISPKEDLSFIGHTLNYPNTFHPGSKMFCIDTVKEAHFDRDGYLIVTHDDSTEKFKVDPKHKDEVAELLKSKLGTKFN
jgi:hypothetical protein